MAVLNGKRLGTNNQKRSVCVGVARALVESQILVDGINPFKLPVGSLITSVRVNVTTVSGTSSATVDVLAGADVIANEVAVTVAGSIIATDIPGKNYLATGGEITIKAGSTTPADGALVCDLVIEYIELDKRSGEYTN